MTTADIDYHEFTDLPTDRIYYGRVRANYPYSATSDWVYVTEHDKPAMLMASVGILDLDPQLKLHAASGSTLTFEWSYTDDKATDAARSYNVELFRDEACTDLYVSWLADGQTLGRAKASSPRWPATPSCATPSQGSIPKRPITPGSPT